MINKVGTETKSNITKNNQGQDERVQFVELARELIMASRGFYKLIFLNKNLLFIKFLTIKIGA